MRWNTLFQDLELELQGLHRQQEAQEVREQIRTQASEITFVDRLRGNVGRELEITTRGSHEIQGVLTQCYPQWLLMRTVGGEALVPVHSVVAVSGLDPHIATPAGPTASRLTLAHALRGLARDRSGVQIETVGGQFWGIFGQIGRDWAQLRIIRQGELRPVSAAGHYGEVTLAHEAMCVVLNKN